MKNIEFLFVGFSFVWILLLGYVGIQHHRIRSLEEKINHYLDDREESSGGEGEESENS
ncbi:MAG: hypothetical protein ABEJ65_10315 [bacterium]